MKDWIFIAAPLGFVAGVSLSSAFAKYIIFGNVNDEANYEHERIVRCIREDAAGAFSTLVITNGLLAAILAALLFK